MRTDHIIQIKKSIEKLRRVFKRRLRNAETIVSIAEEDIVMNLTNKTNGLESEIQ